MAVMIMKKESVDEADIHGKGTAKKKGQFVKILTSPKAFTILPTALTKAESQTSEGTEDDHKLTTKSFLSKAIEKRISTTQKPRKTTAVKPLTTFCIYSYLTII